MTCRPKVAKLIWSEIQDNRHGRHLESLFRASSSEQKIQRTRNSIGSIRVTCRSKLVKFVSIKIQDSVILKNLFSTYSPETKGHLKGQLTRHLVGSIRKIYRVKMAHIISIWNPRWASFENLFWLFSSELKGHLIRNLTGSSDMTPRSKTKAKIVSVETPTWPPRPPSWNCVWNFFSWTERPFDTKLVRSIAVTCHSKLAKTIQIEKSKMAAIFKMY